MRISVFYHPQVEAAVAAAKEAFPDWSARSSEQRAQVLNKLADLMEAHLEEFAQAESRDQGVLYCFNTCCIIKSQSRYQSGSQGHWVSGTKLTGFQSYQRM